jgi:hypothetical protein
MGRTIAIALVCASVVAAPALAGYKLIPAAKTQPVGMLGLWVTPPNDWNRLGAKIGRNAESWTLDGLSFYAGIEEGKPLFRDVDKKNTSLPKFTASMLPTGIVSLRCRSAGRPRNPHRSPKTVPSVSPPSMPDLVPSQTSRWTTGWSDLRIGQMTC